MSQIEMDAAEANEPDEPSKKVVAAIVIPVIAVAIASQIGDALTTTWADQHPLALMALNSRNRILLLVTNQLDAVSYYTVGTVRLMLTDPLYFLIGVLWGPKALAWARSKMGNWWLSKWLRWLEDNFQKAAVPFILIMPNMLISVIAGATGMKARTFFAINFVGTVGRLYLLRWLGDAFADTIDSVLDTFAEYRLPFFVASVLLVAVSVRRKKGGTGELADFRSLERELTD